MTHTIAFQGRPGAYSDLACRTARPGWKTLPCPSFQAAIDAVREGRATLGMLACENSLAGRVPEIHALLPEAGLPIIGEHFQRVEHCLIALPGTRIEEVKRVHTHPVALGQIRNLIRELGVEACSAFDTAGAAEMVVKWQSREDAAIASSLAAELNGLEVLRANVEDAAHNTTRFYLVARQAAWPSPQDERVITTLVFRVLNRAGALYEALGGFAANGVNMTRLESYMSPGTLTATGFLLDVEGHPEQEALGRALAVLRECSEKIAILGVYPASPSRYPG
ncbi:prephenate dehydratase [Asaia bogorensis]|uniref:prephenate dehydratase n=1 Tax=Asaia bogorensis NBRC 16594 TaxID=1231624 RepID=A0AAN4R4A9_9PROT|nr:prephenate dehydratase [Asaia bogorensis]BAT19412.1 prephenate dehydratase [Asaia bogorensis NBRC 16594]GBQ81891.1 prephenate dehydratase [Asaia bogorensis NBRC 16594]GEL54092.1 prephenate dehydratase [Asaia bogorensis NBRC 16594]